MCLCWGLGSELKQWVGVVVVVDVVVVPARDVVVLRECGLATG